MCRCSIEFLFSILLASLHVSLGLITPAPTRSSLAPSFSPTTSPPSINFGQLAAENIFPYTGTVQTVKVPSGVTSIYLYLWYDIFLFLHEPLISLLYIRGGGGAGFYQQGGAGAYVEGVLSVQPGSTLSVIVGGGGLYYDSTTGVSDTGTFGGGGSCPPGSGLICSQGGGRSAIQFSNEDIVTAGGGGGGGNNGYAGGAATSYSSSQIQTTAFGGGATSTQTTECTASIISVAPLTYAISGGGGSVSVGGCVSPNNGTKYLVGSAAAGGAGAGGGGYFGGGGGASYAGGGGGSSLLTNLTTYSMSQSLTTNGPACSGQSSPYYNSSSCGQGGIFTSSGQNGLVVISTVYSFSPTTSPSSFTPSITPSRSPTSLRPSLPTEPTKEPTRAPTFCPSTFSPSVNFGLLAALNMFPYTGSIQSVQVPSSVTSIYVYLWWDKALLFSYRLFY